MDTTEISAHMGGFIARRRDALGLSLQDVADRAGCTKSHIWELEKGRASNPTISMAIGLCEALECNLSSLLGFDASSPQVTDDEMALIAAHRRIFSAPS